MSAVFSHDGRKAPVGRRFLFLTPIMNVDYGSVALAVSLVFGGCCSNAWSLERLLKESPSIGSAVTIAQLIFITLQASPDFINFKSSPWKIPRLKKRDIPISTWFIHVVMMTLISLLNNWAFAYHIPLTLQIIFRSAGLPITMAIGYLSLNKTYTLMQILSVICVTVGVLVATLSKPSSGRSSTEEVKDVYLYAIGVGMLAIATVLASTLGMLQERTYSKYGAHTWREGVFYTHLLTLPVYSLFYNDIKRGFSILLQPTPTKPKLDTDIFPFTFSIPPLLLVFLLNTLSQAVCVSGVNFLTSQVSSVSVNLVLTARKAMSLCFSVWYFGSGLNQGLAIGSAMVLGGSLAYSVCAAKKQTSSAPSSPVTSKREIVVGKSTAIRVNGKPNGVISNGDVNASHRHRNNTRSSSTHLKKT
ncbi:golgi uridine diphosphate-N- acetylglucosamine transporter [Tulasnella sp. 418]|nr:golgi uridine diphosphate-N- acetylglucosamine transporter [Tulasnella sp. 418]